MNNTCVRLLSVEIKNLKNVAYGKVEMPCSTESIGEDMKSNILGIYGQNGSGKTSVIDALAFLKTLMMGKALPSDIGNFICMSSQSSCLSFQFLISETNAKLIVKYGFTISKVSDGEVSITHEKIAFSRIENGVREPEKILIDFKRNIDGQEFSPKYRYSEISNKKKNDVKISVAKVVSGKDKKSFIFCDEFRELWECGFSKDEIWLMILPALRYFSYVNLFVIRNRDSGIISLEFAIPFSFQYENNKKFAAGNMLVSLSKPTVFEVEKYSLFCEIISEINTVINSIVPNLSISVHEHGTQLLENGVKGMRFELVSKRSETTIPLRYESEGIKKIISILNLLIAMYNNPSVCVAIDELDAGVYEYLLGEVLAVIEETGKGQLIFTSHNLRPLEMISKSSMLFTTTNPNNRFIRLTNVKSSNNLRDLYLRSINLGGQKEPIYEPTKGYEIRRSMRKAGRKFNG